MSGRKVTKHVHVDGVWYRPGDVPPAEHAERITNPKVWEDKVEEREVPGPSQFGTEGWSSGDDGPPSGQVVGDAPDAGAVARPEADPETKSRRGK